MDHGTDQTSSAPRHIGYGYPVPTDGPVGDLLRAQRREPYRPAHLHVMGYKPGYKTLITQVFVPDDPYKTTWSSA